MDEITLLIPQEKYYQNIEIIKSIQNHLRIPSKIELTSEKETIKQINGIYIIFGKKLKEKYIGSHLNSEFEKTIGYFFNNFFILDELENYQKKNWEFDIKTLEEVLKTKILFLDIETNSLSIEKAKIRALGISSLNGEHQLINISELQKELNKYNFLCGFNIHNFDIPILTRFGIDFTNIKTLDLYDIVKKRENVLFPKESPRLNLATLVEKFNIGKKFEFDFEILKKEKFTKEEQIKIKEYSSNDLNLTRNLYLYFESFFASYRSLSSKREIYNKFYLISTPGSFAYSVLCRATKTQPKYGKEKEFPPYQGGYVLTPTDEKFENNIYFVDFNSYYPHILMQCNLISPCKSCKENCGKIYTGSNICNLSGKYCGEKMGKFEEVIVKLYRIRKKMREKKDRRGESIKLIINTTYGITANPVFKNLYHPTTAPDCTKIGRELLKFTIKILRKEGYNVFYGDTDGIFLVDTFQDKDRLIKNCNKIIKFIHENVPFPQETCSMDIESIKVMFFFKGKDDKLNKKQYIYITDKNEFIIKGLPIIKLNASQVAVEIFNDHLKEKIIKTHCCKFPRKYISEIIFNILNENIEKAMIEYNVRDPELYPNHTSLHYQIASKYGGGKHFLIPNKRLGIGKGKLYCSLEEAKNLTIRDLNLEQIYSNLEPFIINPQKELSLFGF